MSILTKINDYFTTRRLDKLERDLRMIKTRIQFEPEYSKLTKKLFTVDKFTRKLTEYIVWRTGDPEIIRNFFHENEGHQSDTDTVDLNLFWQKAPEDQRFVHSGIPALIADNNAKMLFGKEPTIDVTVYKLDESGEPTNEKDDDLSNRAHDILDTIMTENGTMQQLIEAASNASWGGHVFLKFNYDLDIIPYPILETVDIRHGAIQKERGITTAIIFRSWYEHVVGGKTDRYRLEEIYRTYKASDDARPAKANLNADDQAKTRGTQGDAIIEYKLYHLGPKGDEPIPVNSIEETQHLEDDIIVFAGIKGMLAFEIPNRIPNSEFLDSPYGGSDFAHSTTPFDVLDEVVSELARETRDNKSLRLFPASLLPKDKETGAILAPDAFVKNIVKYEGSNLEGSKNEISTQTIPDKTDSLIEKYKQAIATACNNAGISPLALGITGLESIVASEDSQRERNKATIETRNLKLKLWQPIIERILMKELELNAWMQENFPDLDQPGVGEMDVDLDNCRVRLHFPDYIATSDSENITTWGNAKAQGVADTQAAVERIYTDLSKKEQMELIARIRFENNMTTDNPDALSMETLLGTPPAPGTPPGPNPPAPTKPDDKGAGLTPGTPPEPDKQPPASK